jgi:hypothetical protein
MRVREFERLVVKHGVGAAKIDAVTRKLREVGALPKSGRGPNAPHIGYEEAASLLISVAGSAKGTEAHARLAKLAPMVCTDLDITFMTLADAIAHYLDDMELLVRISHIRISRTSRYAEIVHHDGTVSEFRGPGFSCDLFRAEGILPIALLIDLAEELDSVDTPARGQGGA